MTPLLCACAVVMTLETQKRSKKGHLAPSNLTFLLIAIDKNSFLQNDRGRADLQNNASYFLIFALRLSYDLSKISDLLILKTIGNRKGDCA